MTNQIIEEIVKEFDEKEWIKDVLFILGGQINKESWIPLNVLIEEKIRDRVKKALSQERERIVERVEEVLRNRVLDITDEYKGKKFKKGVQVYLGYPKLLLSDLIQLLKE